MIERLPKPEILVKLEFAEECLKRLITGHERAVYIMGPTGVGKDVLVTRVFAEAGIELELIQDASLFGVRAAFMENPTAYFWLNDYDAWLDDSAYLNFLKNATEPGSTRLLGARNQTTLRKKEEKVAFDGRLVNCTNVDLFSLSKSVQRHVEAVTGRGKLINLSSDPLELLKYIDYWVCELDYFRTAKFRQVTEINRPISLADAQAILDFVHANAWRLPLSLRSVNAIAKELKFSREHWLANCAAMFQPPLERKDAPPPAPIIYPYGQRHGLPARAAALPEPVQQPEPEPAPIAEPEPEVEAVVKPTKAIGREPRTKKPAKPTGPERLSKEWFRQEVLSICAGLFQAAKITVEDDGVMVEAERDRQVFLRAKFPPILDGGESEGWVKIKAKEYETCDVRSHQVAGQAVINDFHWDHEFDIGFVAAIVAERKLGGDREMIDAVDLGGDANRHAYDFKDVAKVLKRKPQQWRLCDRGVLGATLERDGVTYEFYLRSKPR